MLDPLRPYLSLIGAVLGLAMLLGSGCVGWELRDAKADKAAAAAQRKVESLEGSLNDFIRLYNEVNAEAALAEQQAEAWRVRADDEARLAQDRHRRTMAQLAALEAELDIARADPTCRAQLETPLCALLY